MWYAVIFVIGILTGAVSVVTYALMVANTRYEEAAKKKKTNADMMRLADKQQVTKAMKRLYGKVAMLLTPLLKEAQEKKIEEWLEKEADAEWKE
jgi:uncharacterized membrane protein (DUF106 family)